MAYYYLQHVRPLHSLTDEEILQIVDEYCLGIYQVNSRRITKVETLYRENGDESQLFFRMTTEDNNYPDRLGIDAKVSGFCIEFWDDQQLDLRFTPLNKLTYFEKWLTENGITEDFAEHRVSINAIYRLFHDKLKIWNRDEFHPLHNYAVCEPYQWRQVQGIEVLQTNI